MNLNDVYKKSDDIASRTVDGEAVLVTASEGSVTVLNEVGSVIWDSIDGEKTVEDIIDILCNEFAIDKKTATDDCSDFIDELKEKDFIVS